MQIDEFKSIVSTFSDPGQEMLFEGKKVVFSVNSNLIEINITNNSGDIQVDDGSGSMPASLWVVKRLANLPLLADRLMEQIPHEDNFISPSARLLPSLNIRDKCLPEVDDALQATLTSLGEKSPFETTVLYITSDAGEGKTCLINAAARKQAKEFSEGKSDWLLVPIVLGGRNFLRFDDITVGMLQNRYRFPFLYYNSFLALVRMGVIVPAFDGFEEMFVENSSGEALSAMGILVGALKSTGAVVIAARKAYFEFENLKSQEKLYDTIRDYSVDFSKLELIRWKEKQFIEYCKKRKIPEPKKIYEKVKERLREDHPLLTRPVLIRRLVDIAEDSNSIDEFLEKINVSGANFFSVFVRKIIEREANEKWIDRSGNDIASPLLTVDEHCELLSMIAVEMWKSRVSYLRKDYLDVVAELFCDLKRKTSQQLHQIRERIRGHALLVSSSDMNSAVAFDHDEFRQFFLGEGLAETINQKNNNIKSDVRSIVDKGVLPDNSRLAFVHAIKRNHDADRLKTVELLVKVGKLDGQASYTQENCGNLLIHLVSELDAKDMLIDNFSFGIDALRDRKLKNISFENCYFSQSSWELTTLEECSFSNCNFGQIIIYESTTVTNVYFNECIIDSIKINKTEIEIFDPIQIKKYLKEIGILFKNNIEEINDELPINQMPDDKLISIEKLLRYFMRSTHISESVIKIKIGGKVQEFIDNDLPELIDNKIIVEIDNRGGTYQRRFKLGLPLVKINQNLSSANGNYLNFLAACRQSLSE